MNYLSNRVLFFLFSITRAIVKRKKKKDKRGTLRFVSILAGQYSICVIRYILFYQTFVSIVRTSGRYKNQQE